MSVQTKDISFPGKVRVKGVVYSLKDTSSKGHRKATYEAPEGAKVKSRTVTFSLGQAQQHRTM